MSAEKSSINLQDRDVALLRGLFESRVMTAGHVSAMYFDGAREATKKRLQKLKAAGLVSERVRRAYEPSLLFLAPKGLALLKERGVLKDYPPVALPALARRAQVSDLTLHHELEVMDVKAAFHRAIRKEKAFSIETFSTWPQLYEFTATRPGYGSGNVTVKPDGFIRIHEEEQDGGLSEYSFFLEVDRSTEVLDTIVVRAGCYLHYFRSGGFAAWNGADRSAYKEHPFRLLLVFKTAERRNNVAERLLNANPPVFALAYLSTLDEVKRDPLAPIWICAIDYRDAMKDTPFDPERRKSTYGYIRQTERDLLAAKKLKGRSLISG